MKRKRTPAEQEVAQTTDWYAEGQGRSVIIDGLEIVVRLVGRKGRRARICVTAPAGARFVAHETRSRRSAGDASDTGAALLGRELADRA